MGASIDQPAGGALPPAPEESPAVARFGRFLMAPIERFLAIEAASGLLLLVVAIVALVAVNTGWADAYEHLLKTPIGLRVGGLSFEHDIHFWINDGLMTVFFFLVGLEIRREIHAGELSTVRRAALPALAALGGMAAPALIYLAVARIAGGGAEVSRGWGVPMATDIAFAVGVLALLGKRIPHALRVLLLALAIIDDIGAIVVIAVFYSGNLDLAGMGLAALGVAAILLMQRFGIRRAALYIVPGVVIWAGMLRSGIHPTIAGVIVGLLTPARERLAPAGLVDAVRRSADTVEHEVDSGEPGKIAEGALAREASRLELARREALAPALRLQLMLHPWAAFVIMPLFAFANAGVVLKGSTGMSSPVVIGVGAGLVLGKPIGVLLACALAVRTRIATLPRGLGVRELVVLGLVAGIGFTMALFVASLAFDDPAFLEQAKVAILGASAVAIVVGLLAGRLLLSSSERGARSAHEAECSDEM
jgi:Na+:H+ antiporter, NhaA family